MRLPAILLIIICISCNTTSSHRPRAGTVEKQTTEDVNSGSGNPNPNQTVSGDSSHPKILFHGGGGYTPSMFKDMTPAADAIASLGVSAQNIHIVSYPDTENIDIIKAALNTQLQTIFSRYPTNTTFDAIGHSLGLLVSFVSLTELGYLPKIRSIIGVTGVLMRQDESAMPLGCKKGDPNDLCGDIFDLVVGPTDSAYILNLLNTNTTELRRIKKCSLWTQQDGVLSPPNAGVFPDGIGVEMPTSWCTLNPIFGKLNPCHLKAKNDLAIYQTIKTQCFNGDFN